jgi:hypothetical protein
MFCVADCRQIKQLLVGRLCLHVLPKNSAVGVLRVELQWFLGVSLSCDNPTSILPDRRRWLDEPTPASGDRIPPGRESHSPRTTRRQTQAFHRRPAHPARSQSKAVGRRHLGQIATIVTPDTLLRWFRALVARKWTSARTNSVGRPPVDPELEKLVLKLIQENPSWGSNRIVGALDNLGYTLCDSTIDNIRRRNGFDPAPVRDKNTTWRRFLQAHWDTLIAADFFTTEVLSWNGLVTFYTLFVIDLRSRSVHVCGTTMLPNAQWMRQAAQWTVSHWAKCTGSLTAIPNTVMPFGRLSISQA